MESLWNVFEDKVISNTSNFIPPVKGFKCPPGKNGINRDDTFKLPTNAMLSLCMATRPMSFKFR